MGSSKQARVSQQVGGVDSHLIVVHSQMSVVALDLRFELLWRDPPLAILVNHHEKRIDRQLPHPHIRVEHDGRVDVVRVLLLECSHLFNVLGNLAILLLLEVLSIPTCMRREEPVSQVSQFADMMGN